MLETAFCVSLIFNIIAALVIAKQNSIIKEQNSLLEETAPVIDRVYNERHGDDK